MPTTAAKKNTSFAVVAETTEGTYAAPASATSYVQVLDSGADISLSKELLSRNVFTASIGKTASRTGQYKASGTLATEARAFSTEGGKPEYNTLMQSGMGAVRQSTSVVTTKATGNTGSTLAIQDADIAAFNVGDIICVKEAGAFFVSPITAVTTTAGSASITLLISRPSGSFPASVTIGKFTTYTVADAGHPCFSLSKYIEGARLEFATGCRVNSIGLDGFQTGKIPSWKFGFEGLNGGSSMTASPYTPSYDTANPPIVLDGRVYQAGAAVAINQLSVTLTNTIAFQSDISQVNGRSSGRATARDIKGTFNPYKSASDVAQFTTYKNNTPYSIFAYAKVPGTNAGEFGNIVAIYMPSCITTDLKETDDSGLLVDSISFEANRGNGTTPEIYISFI